MVTFVREDDFAEKLGKLFQYPELCDVYLCTNPSTNGPTLVFRYLYGKVIEWRVGPNRSTRSNPSSLVPKIEAATQGFTRECHRIFEHSIKHNTGWVCLTVRDGYRNGKARVTDCKAVARLNL